MKKKAPILSENNLDLVRDLGPKATKKISESIRLLKKEISNSSDNQDIESYNAKIKKLAKDGGPKNIENL
ncbi:hypothetical protein [Pseudomonas syringae]|uniref:hypothetical protein n=1 Tax=Pseudomonas syringae TaxID=317 RepID=UPI0015E18201|nr:hypothetical protein [Pseudomonas syringae]